MKVLFLVAHMNSGGAERTVAYLSRYLANQEGMEVTILSLSNEIFYEIDPKVKLSVLNINSKSKNVVMRLWNICRRQIAVRSYIAKHKPDAVFCMMVSAGKYLLSSKRKYRLITSERINPEVVKDPKLLKLKNKLFSISDGIVFQTKRAQNFYPQAFREKSVVIYNAVGNELVYQVPQVIERKKKITAIGRLSDQKDYPTLFEAFAICLQKHPEYTLELFGDGPDKEKLRVLAENMGISSSVIFKGAQKDAILQAADSACYVMSSLYEGMPNALMEAMGAGLPCVSTDCPNGPAELISQEENGLLVPVGSSDSLANAILKMIEDKDFAQKCGNNAKKILETNSVDVIAKQFMDFIIAVVEKRKER